MFIHNGYGSCLQKPEEFSNTLIHHTGTHNLKWYLDTIGYLLFGSEQEEILKIIHVSHMLTDKAHSRAVRRHEMLSSVLNSMLLQNALDSKPSASAG